MSNRTHTSLFVSNVCHNVLNVCHGSVRFVSTTHSVKMGSWELTEISCARIELSAPLDNFLFSGIKYNFIIVTAC